MRILNLAAESGRIQQKFLEKNIPWTFTQIPMLRQMLKMYYDRASVYLSKDRMTSAFLFFFSFFDSTHLQNTKEAEGIG